MGYLDYSQLQRMSARVPPLSVIPPINKRISMGRFMLSAAIFGPACFMLSMFLCKSIANSMPLTMFPVKRQFAASPDFLTGKVHMKQRMVGTRVQDY